MIVQYLVVVQLSRGCDAASQLWFHTFAIGHQSTIRCITFTTIMIYRWNLEWNSTQWKSLFRSLTPFSTSCYIALCTIVLPSTYPVFSMLMMLVMLFLSLLLWLQGMGWLLLAIEDPPEGRTAEDYMLGSVAATKQRRLLKQLSGFTISSSGT